MEIMAAYAEHLRRGGAAPTTVTCRVLGVHALAARCGDPAMASVGQIQDWLMLAHPGWTRVTYWRHATAFYRFLVDTGRRDDDPTDRIPRPRSPRGVPRPIDGNVLAAAIHQAHGRDLTMLLLAAYEGLRIHEIAKLRGRDVIGELLYVEGKGGVAAVLPLHPLLVAQAPLYPAGWWFPSSARPGQPIGSKTVYVRMKHALHAVGSEASPHMLRHWYGTQVLRSSGGNLRVAQELLRHASPATTAIYTEVDGVAKAAAVAGLPVVAWDRDVEEG